MKLGIIRCMRKEDYCPGTTDFKMIKERKGVFEGIYEDIELSGCKRSFCNQGAGRRGMYSLINSSFSTCSRDRKIRLTCSPAREK